MSTNVTQKAPYLRNQRKFPFDDVKSLAFENDRAYIDIATKVNDRIIGIFAVNNPTVTGEKWFLSGEPQGQQTLRQIYTFNNSTTTIPHGITFSSLTNFTKIYGTFFDGTNWQALPYVDTTNVNKQITLNVDSANINIVRGGGAVPTTNNGIIVLEWLSEY